MLDHSASSAAGYYLNLSSRLGGATIVAIAIVFASASFLLVGQALAAGYVVCVLAALIFLILSLIVGWWGTARTLVVGDCAQWSVREARTFWVVQCILVCVGLILSGLSVVFIL